MAFFEGSKVAFSTKKTLLCPMYSLRRKEMGSHISASWACMFQGDGPICQGAGLGRWAHMFQGGGLVCFKEIGS